MKAIVVEGPGRYGLTTVDDPTPERDGIVVAVDGCGICGTDLHILEHALPTAPYPLVPGHEPWGHVVAIGRDVDTISEGDRVAIDPSLHCGECRYCRRGRGNLCERWGAIGATRHGAWADFVAAPARNAHRLDESIDDATAALAEPVACALHGLDRLDVQPGDRAVVYGAGAMGLILTEMIAAVGAGPVTVVESRSDRRRFASEQFGFDVVERYDGAAVPLAIDATGHPAAVAAALGNVERGGTLLVFGVADPAASLAVSPFRVYNDELRIIGSMAIGDEFSRAVEALARHGPRLRRLVTHRAGLESFDEALTSLRGGDAVKVVLDGGAASQRPVGGEGHVSR